MSETSVNRGSVLRGVGVWFAIVAAGAVIWMLLSLLGLNWPVKNTIVSSIGYFLLIAPFQVGLWQWLGVVPFLRKYRRRGENETAKGLLIAACCMFALNVLCSGVAFVR